MSHQLCQHRRQILPSPVVSAEISALSIIRKNVGKDLSTISMPISLNEPLSMLQRACEELEYSEILDKASTLSDSLDRLLHVAVFAVSGYASSQHRTGRKPFNPMMNETYELIRPDKGFRFIAEKVSHNPLIIAAHAESRNYKYWQCVKMRTKFWGKSMELINEGTFHVTLTGHNDHYTFSKPSSWLRNMIAGNKYIEHVGEMKVVNHSTAEYVVVTFKESTGGSLFTAPKPSNEVVMTAYDKHGAKRRRVVGKWTGVLAEEVDMNPSQLSILWTATPPHIQDPAKYYGFSRFAMELNEITEIEKDSLPKTDARLRPDLRLYEQGYVNDAEQEKIRIEQKQRDRRKELESLGVEWKPRWFRLERDEFAAEPGVIPSSSVEGDRGSPASWQFTGEYWHVRETGQWPSDQFDIW
ncbi:Oxysterol-binding protein [Dichotomocladium elegans]|nr:Oxysterol-binding protein [Dichotomocladium elegans]